MASSVKFSQGRTPLGGLQQCFFVVFDHSFQKDKTFRCDPVHTCKCICLYTYNLKTHYTYNVCVADVTNKNFTK